MVQNCEQALAEAEEQAGLQAKRVVIGIEGELVKGVTNTIKYRRPQPDRPLDEAEMDFIIEKVQERAQTKAQKQIALETGNEDVEAKDVYKRQLPYYVVGKAMSQNVVYVSQNMNDENIWRRQMALADVHWINDEPTEEQLGKLSARIRHRASLISTSATYDVNTLNLELTDEQRAVTPGQSVVLYSDCLLYTSRCV